MGNAKARQRPQCDARAERLVIDGLDVEMSDRAAVEIGKRAVIDVAPHLEPPVRGKGVRRKPDRREVGEMRVHC
jgi:hypothetical protein